MRVLLAKVQIGNRISLLDNYVWNDGSTHNFWETDGTFTSLRKLIREITDPDGHRAVVDRMNVSGVEYAQKDSAHLVNSTQGSFYHDDSQNTLYARGHAVPIDSLFQYDAGLTNYRDWTDEAANASTSDAFRKIPIKPHVGDMTLIGMEFSRIIRIKIEFDPGDLPSGGTRKFVYWNGSTWADLTVTAVVNNNNWTSGASSYEGIITVPSDLTRTDTIGDGDTGTPMRFWIASKVLTTYGTTGGKALRVQTEAVLEERRSVAWFWFRLGNTLKDFAEEDAPFLPYIPKDSKGFTSLLEANDATIPIYGANQPTDAGTLDLGNGEGIFDAPLRSKVINGLRQDYEWRGGYVDLFTTVERSNLPSAFADYVQVGRSLTEGLMRSDTGLQLRFMNLMRQLENTSRLPRYSTAQYKNMDLRMVGKEIPAYLGNTANLAGDDTSKEAVWGRLIPTTRVKKGVENLPTNPGQFHSQRYKACTTMVNPETGFRHGCSISAVYIKYADVIPSTNINSNKYDQVEGGTAVQFDDTVDITDGTDEIRFEMQGYLDDDDGTFTGTAGSVITRPEDIMHFLWVCVAKKPTAMLNIPSLCRVGLTKQGQSGILSVPDAYRDNASVYIGQDVKLQDLFNELCLQYLAVFQPNNEGLFTLTPMTVALENSDRAYFEEDLAKFEDELSLDYVISTLTLGFRQLPADNSYTPISSPQAKDSPLPSLFPGFVIDNPSQTYGWPEKPISANTFMVTEAKVTALNQVIFDWLKNGAIKSTTAAIIGSGLQQLLSERTLLTRSRAIGGPIDERATYLIRSERDYASGTNAIVTVEAGPDDAPTTVTPEGMM